MHALVAASRPESTNETLFEASPRQSCLSWLCPRNKHHNEFCLVPTPRYPILPATTPYQFPVSGLSPCYGRAAPAIVRGCSLGDLYILHQPRELLEHTWHLLTRRANPDGLGLQRNNSKTKDGVGQFFRREAPTNMVVFGHTIYIPDAARVFCSRHIAPIDADPSTVVSRRIVDELNGGLEPAGCPKTRRRNVGRDQRAELGRRHKEHGIGEELEPLRVGSGTTLTRSRRDVVQVFI